MESPNPWARWKITLELESNDHGQASDIADGRKVSVSIAGGWEKGGGTTGTVNSIAYDMGACLRAVECAIVPDEYDDPARSFSDGLAEAYNDSIA